MSIPRIYVDMDLALDATVALPEGAYRHLIVVLRRVPGGAITLFNGHGGEYGAVLESVKRGNLTARITEFRGVNRESPLNVTLAQAVSKGERMDYTIQKAVELGVSSIQPLVTDHAVVKLSEERWQRKQEHWQNVAISACEQSGRTRVPHIARVVDLRDWLPSLPTDVLRLVLSLNSSKMLNEMKSGMRPVLLAVGPEGDFSDTEQKLLDDTGFERAWLGPRLLRTETAGVVALSVLQSLWGDLGAHKGS